MGASRSPIGLRDVARERRYLGTEACDPRFFLPQTEAGMMSRCYIDSVQELIFVTQKNRDKSWDFSRWKSSAVRGATRVKTHIEGREGPDEPAV
jgi:hypothetical protein